MEGTEERSILAIQVTETQRETIRHLFNHNDWDFQEVPIEESTDQSNLSNNDQETEEFIIYQNQEAEVCQYCLSRPCITSETNRQMWWIEEPETPNRSNTHRRKDKYKRFWTMLFHRNVWADPRYKERKRRFLQHDPRRRNHAYHRRDIMPKCVVDLVRHWLPNLKDQPYMGHMWE